MTQKLTNRVYLISFIYIQDYGETALICASCEGHQGTVDLLLQRGASINLQDEVIFVYCSITNHVLQLIVLYC